MICATPCIVSFDKYFKQHQGIALLWFICQRATRESFSRPFWKLFVFGPKCAAMFMCQSNHVPSNPLQLPSYHYCICLNVLMSWQFRILCSFIYLIFQLGFVNQLSCFCYFLLFFLFFFTVKVNLFHTYTTLIVGLWAVNSPSTTKRCNSRRTQRPIPCPRERERTTSGVTWTGLILPLASAPAASVPLAHGDIWPVCTQSSQHVKGYSCNHFPWLGLDPEA